LSLLELPGEVLLLMSLDLLLLLQQLALLLLLFLLLKKDYKALEKSHEKVKEKGSSKKSTYFTVNSQKSDYADANFFCHISLNE
jgi:hypothetical protein